MPQMKNEKQLCCDFIDFVDLNGKKLPYKTNFMAANPCCETEDTFLCLQRACVLYYGEIYFGFVLFCPV